LYKKIWPLWSFHSTFFCFLRFSLSGRQCTYCHIQKIRLYVLSMWQLFFLLTTLSFPVLCQLLFYVHIDIFKIMFISIYLKIIFLSIYIKIMFLSIHLKVMFISIYLKIMFISIYLKNYIYINIFKNFNYFIIRYLIKAIYYNFSR
jgi:hypothetical protein